MKVVVALSLTLVLIGGIGVLGCSSGSGPDDGGPVSGNGPSAAPEARNQTQACLARETVLDASGRIHTVSAVTAFARGARTCAARPQDVERYARDLDASHPKIELIPEDRT